VGNPQDKERKRMPYDIASLQRVRCYQLPKSFSEADLFLRRLRETVHLMVVYHTNFPEEFPRDWRADQQKLLPEDENTYSEAELNSLRLIEERLFPFALEHLLMCADEGERLATIPLWPYGIDHGERPISSFVPGWRMLLLLLVEKTRREVWRNFGGNRSPIINVSLIQQAHLSCVCSYLGVVPQEKWT
jgi:hypothetical protein